MSGVYVHIPFCRRKCYYCDFFSIGSRNAPWKEYVEAVINEGQLRADEVDAHRVDTIYIGGGTPSQMPIGILDTLLKGIVHIFSPAGQMREFTVEVNPEDITEDLADCLQQCGVTRVSMGVQSFIDAELAEVGRRHNRQQAISAYDILRSRFSNLSIDLMFGLPGQTLESWSKSISEVLTLMPEHISAYSLMWEENTALTKMRNRGRVRECDDNINDSMYLMLTEKIKEAGYEHYEISNYCLPGYRSIHNSSYWKGTPYLGLGPSAHSYDGGKVRRANPADIGRYISHFTTNSKGVFYEKEILTIEELQEEYLITGLRRCEGINLADFRLRFGETATTILENKARRMPELVMVENGRLCLRGEGLMRSDMAIVELM